MKKFFLGAALLLLSARVYADTCYATSSAPTNQSGQINQSCDSSGNLRTTTGGGGGGGSVTQGTVPWVTQPQLGGTATGPTQVAMTGGSVQVLPANATRIQAVLANNTGVACNYAYSGAASATTFPFPSAATAYIDKWKGAINVLCASGNVVVQDISP